MAIVFADNIVIYCKCKKGVENELDRLRYATEIRGMKISLSTTKYMCVSETCKWYSDVT